MLTGALSGRGNHPPAQVKPWPYGFTGQYHDQETGLIYFHARYYNPIIGHFNSPDSVVPNPSDTFSYDRYAYCRNNPVNLTDPSGHDPFIGAIVGAIIGGVLAAVTGGNIWAGIVTGAIAGATFQSAWFAGIKEAGTQFAVSVAVGVASGGITAAFQGANILQGALIGGFSSAVSFGIGQSSWAQTLAGKGSFGQGFVSVMSGGVVGGLSNVAMGGNFWQGFTQGGVSAGLSFAANAVANKIKDVVISGGHGGSQTKTQSKDEPTPEEQKAAEQGPLADIPAVDPTLPEDQRTAYILKGRDFSKQEKIAMRQPIIDKAGTPEMGAGEAADVLHEKGYKVVTIEVKDDQQVTSMAENGDFKDRVVVVSAHHDAWAFRWDGPTSGQQGNAVFEALGNSGASRIMYLSCYSRGGAKLTARLGGMPVWVARGVFKLRLGNYVTRCGVGGCYQKYNIIKWEGHGKWY